MAKYRVYKLRDIEDRIKELGGLGIKRSPTGKDYEFDFHGSKVHFYVLHSREVPDHGIQEIATGMMRVYGSMNPQIKKNPTKYRELLDDIKSDLKGRVKAAELVTLQELSSALGALGAEVQYKGNRVVAKLGDKYVEAVADREGKVHKYEFNNVAQKVADFYHVDLKDVLEHLPKPKRKTSRLEELLGKSAVVMAAFALFAALFWTSATYTGASTATLAYQLGFYGIVGIILAFFSLIMFFHKLHSD